VAAIMLATVIAANSRPATTLVFVPHTGASLRVWMVISSCSFLPLSVWVCGSRSGKVSGRAILVAKYALQACTLKRTFY